MKDKLISALGTFGYILWYAVSFLYCFSPLLILQFPFLVDLVLIFVIMTIPLVGEIVRIALYVWAFTAAVSQPIDALSIIFFVCAALYLFTTLIPFVMPLFSSRKETM